MSWSLGIYADADEPLEEFAANVEGALAIRLERRSDAHSVWYDYDDPLFYLMIYEHELENDRDPRFEDYRYEIALWPKRGSHPEEVMERWRTVLAPAMFEKLKATGRYDLMLVEEVQRKLAEYHPALEPVR